MTADLTREPVEWALTYPVSPHDPIGYVRRVAGGYSARLEFEDLGVYPSGDDAATAIWARFVEKSHVDHEIASRVHGSAERH